MWITDVTGTGQDEDEKSYNTPKYELHLHFSASSAVAFLRRLQLAICTKDYVCACDIRVITIEENRDLL